VCDSWLWVPHPGKVEWVPGQSAVHNRIVTNAEEGCYNVTRRPSSRSFEPFLSSIGCWPSCYFSKD
jgi:hypothetical protein